MFRLLLRLLVELRKFCDEMPPLVDVRRDDLAPVRIRIDLTDQAVIRGVIFAADAVIGLRMFWRSEF